MQLFGINQSAGLQIKVAVQATNRILEERFDCYLSSLITWKVKLGIYVQTCDNKIQQAFYNTETVSCASDTQLLSTPNYSH